MANKKELKKEWDEFLKIPFPSIPKDEFLYDMFADLVEIDGHVAGIVSSFLGGHKVKKELVYVDNEFNEKLDSYETMNPADERDKQALQEYKGKLDRLVMLVLELWDK